MVKQSGSGLFDEFSVATGVFSDDGGAAGEGFYGGEAEGFHHKRREDEGGGVLVERDEFGLGDVAEEADVGAVGVGLGEFGEEGTVACDV